MLEFGSNGVMLDAKADMVAANNEAAGSSHLVQFRVCILPFSEPWTNTYSPHQIDTDIGLPVPISMSGHYTLARVHRFGGARARCVDFLEPQLSSRDASCTACGQVLWASFVGAEPRIRLAFDRFGPRSLPISPNAVEFAETFTSHRWAESCSVFVKLD